MSESSDPEPRRYYPLLTDDQLKDRVEILLRALSYIQEELMELGNPHSVLPDGQKAMRGAHLTIADYMVEMLLNHLHHDLQLVATDPNDLTVLARLVDLHGKPIA
jgi:hypothetical protein